MNVSNKKNILSNYLLLASGFIVIILTPSMLYSYSAGILGSSSSASMSITLVIHPKLETKIVEDLEISSYMTSPTTKINEAIPLCVRSNGITNYTVTARDHNTEENFSLNNGDNLIPYDVMLKKSTDDHFKALKSGQPSQPLNALSKNQSCDLSPKLALKAHHSINKNQPIYGALNLTFSAD